MKKCKQDDYKDTDICKFIYDQLSTIYNQQEYIMENENRILEADAGIQ